MTDYCICMTTFESHEQARPIIRDVIAGRLAACAQVMDIGSTYIWQGELEESAEVLVLFKTRADRYDALAAALAAQHPYETPEILRVPIDAGFAPYLRWMDEQTGA